MLVKLVRSRWGAVVAALVVLVVLAAGCGSTSHPAARKRLDRVTVLTGFGIFGREAAPWVASAKGYFAKQGIQVRIQPGAAGQANLKDLSAGQAQFAAIDFSGAILDVGTGRFRDFRAVAAIQQRTIIAIMTVPGRGITTPQDLAGKRIGVVTGAVPKTLFPAYAKLAGIKNPTSVRWLQTSDPAQLNLWLTTGQVDAIGQFVVGAPAVAAAAHIDVKKVITLPYGNFVSDAYGNVLVTPTSLIKSNRGLVQRFTTAYLQGLAYEVAHPDEAGQILHRANPDARAATAAAELRLMGPYVTVNNSPVGLFSPQRVGQAIALEEGLGLIPVGSTGATSSADTLPGDKVVDYSFVKAP
jgi:NitT/TauT family transport system substrate-binding protein